MNVNMFAKEIAKNEGKKVQVNIAQIKEVLHCANELLSGVLYSLIRGMEQDDNQI